MRAAFKRYGAVQHIACVLDDLGATFFVVARPFGATLVFRNDIGSVQGVVQRTPTCVGCIQSVAGIEDGHHQLRAGLNSQLSIHMGGGGLNLGRHGHQVADLGQKSLVGGHVADRAWVGAVPLVYSGLQTLPLGQQSQVFRGQFTYQRVKTTPKSNARHACSWQNLLIDELIKGGSYLEAVNRGTSGHSGVSQRKYVEKIFNRQTSYCRERAKLNRALHGLVEWVDAFGST